MLRSHDWEYDLDLARAYTRYRCLSCQSSKYEHRDGRVTYETVTFPDDPTQPPLISKELAEEPCCFPPFDPHIPFEDLAKAGFVPVARGSKPQPVELLHEATVRRIAGYLRAESYLSAAERVLVKEKALAGKLAVPWVDDS
jgi:hypothetical protein